MAHSSAQGLLESAAAKAKETATNTSELVVKQARGVVQRLTEATAEAELHDYKMRAIENAIAAKRLELLLCDKQLTEAQRGRAAHRALSTPCTSPALGTTC